MRRRVARVLRGLMFVLGVSIAAWTPISYAIGVQIASPWPPTSSGIVIESGQVAFWNRKVIPALFPNDFYIGARRIHEPSLPSIGGLLPTHTLRGPTTLWMQTVPCWILVVICLAWPVTSFILARRKHKRGFPVEPKGKGEAVSPPVSSS